MRNCNRPAVILLIAVLCLSGCTTTVSVFRDEIDSATDKKLSQAVRPARVFAVRTPANETIDFDSLGGVIDGRDMTVSGRTPSGELRQFSLDSVTYVGFISTHKTGRRYMTPAGVKSAVRNALEKPRSLFKRGQVPCWDVIQFGDEGGAYDLATRTITGTTGDGKAIAIPLDSTRYVQYKYTNIYKTIRTALGAGAFLVFMNGYSDLTDD